MTVSVPLSELSRRATVDKADILKYNIKACIATVRKLFEQGDLEYYQHDIQNAYVHYMKGCSVMIEVIGKHPNYKDAKKDPTYQHLKGRANDDILERLEKLMLEIQVVDAANVEDDPLEETMAKYPSLQDIAENQTQSDFLLDDLPSVPTHAPLKTQKNRSSPLPAPPPMHIKMPEPMPMPIPVPIEKDGIQLPSPTGFSFPPSLVVEASQLAAWISKRNETGPSILILDVRPRDVAERGCIKHRWIAQIEPLVLKQDVASIRIEESMMMNRDPEQIIFAARNRFDLVVYYDQSSQVPQNNPHNALNNLRSAIYEMEFQKTLQRAPMMLYGGFDAWKAVVGDRGIHKYDESVEETHHLTPVQHHKTMYDLFGDSWSPGNKEPVNRHTDNNVGTPPLRGIFSHSLAQPAPLYSPTSMPMPIPQPLSNNATPDIETFTTKYPEIRPNASTNGKLSRKNTFIDNPFNSFTRTSNKRFGVPPLPPKHLRPSPTQPSAPPLPPKPSQIYASSPPANNRTAPVSDNSFSQLGAVKNGITGLKNLGNTCYMNSIIQCLSGTGPLARYFLTGSYKKHINKENCLGTGGVVAEGFASLLRTMWRTDYNFISPAVFRNALIEFAPQYKGSEQHDSQEFLGFLLDSLHEDCNLVRKRPVCKDPTEEEDAWFEQLPDWKASAIAWEKYLLRNSSVVVSLLQGQYKSQLRCLTCNATSTTYNTFMSLTLPIPTKGKGHDSVSIYQCLDHFVKEETLENGDAWNCPKCKTLRKANKKLTLSKLPDVLLITLKRFSYDGPFKNKLETIVDSPMNGLDLSKYVPSTMFIPNQPIEKSTFCYDLYAVSNHFGTLTGGHYTACVRGGYRDGWRNFDDSRFSPCDESKVLTRAAYNLFYVRSTVK